MTTLAASASLKQSAPSGGAAARVASACPRAAVAPVESRMKTEKSVMVAAADPYTR